MTADAKHRLLIVDDDALIRAMLKDHFEAVGYAVDAAQDAPEALGRLSRDYDAILSDIVMPKLSGIDFLQQVRVKKPEMPVFLMTSRPSLQTLNAARRYGALAYFRKPLNLPEVEARLRGFLEEAPGTIVDGRVLVVGQELMDRLGERVGRLQTIVCPADETPFLRVVREQRPKAVLADATGAGTSRLLRAYRALEHEANSFLLVGDEAALDAASDLLFNQGAAGCIPAGASREELEQGIREAVELRERQRLDQPDCAEAPTSMCLSAKAYRHGYYCLKQDACPHGPFQEGWISVSGKEYQKCAKRPLLVAALGHVGFAVWTGHIDPTQAAELRKQLMARLRADKQTLVINAQGLDSANYSLFEVLSDVAEELGKRHPGGLIHVINLTPSLQNEFRKSVSNKGIRFHGVRMLDERSSFARWGSRFD